MNKYWQPLNVTDETSAFFSSAECYLSLRVKVKEKVGFYETIYPLLCVFVSDNAQEILGYSWKLSCYVVQWPGPRSYSWLKSKSRRYADDLIGTFLRYQ